MTKLILPFLLLLFLSCNKQPKCNDPDVEKMVIQTLQKKISDNVESSLKNDENIINHENYKSFQPLLKNREKYLKELETKLFDFRTTEVKTDIKKCNCEAEISVVDKDNRKLNEIETDWVGGDFNIENYNPTIKYSVQITDENKIFITLLNYEDFEIYERNILANVLLDIRNKNKTLIKTSKSIQVNNNAANVTALEDKEIANIDYEISQEINIIPGNYYYVNASSENPVFFYNSANHNDRKKTKFTTYEKVYVESVSGDFGFVRFTNTNNQTSKGWIRFLDMGS